MWPGGLVEQCAGDSDTGQKWWEVLDEKEDIPVEVSGILGV